MLHHKEHYSDCCRSVAPYRAYIGTVVDLCTKKSIIVTAVDVWHHIKSIMVITVDLWHHKGLW